MTTTPDEKLDPLHLAVRIFLLHAKAGDQGRAIPLARDLGVPALGRRLDPAEATRCLTAIGAALRASPTEDAVLEAVRIFLAPIALAEGKGRASGPRTLLHLFVGPR